MEAVRQIKEAKDAEVRMLERLAQQDRHTEQRRQAATLEADDAEFAKLEADRQLRQWLHDHESPRAQVSLLHHHHARDNPHVLSPRGGGGGGYVMQQQPQSQSQRKPAFFPRMIMFLARKRAQSHL
ncbi:unnamed protein product [Urochloa humidicola]